MTIADIQDRTDLTLVQDEGDLMEINGECGTDFGGFFVNIGEGCYTEIYGYYGYVPTFDKQIHPVPIPEAYR